MIIYIAGQISGRDNYKQFFDDAQIRLEQEGHIVINPSFLPVGLETDRYLPICLPMLDASDAIYLLKGWETSKGACLERLYAEYQGKKIIKEGNGDGEHK